jgi:hypothetical protein
MPPQALLETQDRQDGLGILATQVLLEVRPLQVPQGIQGIPVVRDLQETLDLRDPQDLQEPEDLQILHLELQDRQAIQVQQVQQVQQHRQAIQAIQVLLAIRAIQVQPVI